MSELRFNPILREWVITATHRQERPLLVSEEDSKKSCPFCVPAEEVPEPYSMVCLPNRFPSLHLQPPQPGIKGDDFYKVLPSQGAAEVVLYSSDHKTTLSQQSVRKITSLISLWQERYRVLGRKKFVRYVFIFENKGEVIGVTMPHPHGQIYAFPFIPPVIERELSSSESYLKEEGRCIHCEVIKKEKEEGRRIISENKDFLAFIPFYARWPYEVHIYPQRHILSLSEFEEEEKGSLAEILKVVLSRYDHLFNFSFPYVMVIHQSPTDEKDYSYYHFHLEFYPPHRSAQKIKYLAGSESGAGTFINDTSAEEKAKELRSAI